MKTRKKLLIALLSATCLTAGAFGLAACSNADPQPDPTLYAIYNKYVESNPDSALTYEEWLKDKFDSVGQPGQNGANGKDAYEIYVESLPDSAEIPTKEEWLASLVGASGLTPSIGENGNWYLGTNDTGVKAEGVDGLGIKSVAWNADKTALVITYTNDTTSTVTLPEEVTHVHDYTGSPVIAVVPPTGNTEGIGYQVCNKNGCNHIELVTIGSYSYKVTVTYSDIDYFDEYAVGSTPVEGATVTLKDGDQTVASAQTDEKGEVIFKDVERGEYSIVVTKDGYVDVMGNVTEDKVYDYSTVLFSLPSDGDGTSEDAYQLTSTLGREVFFIQAPEAGNVYFEFTASYSGSYTFTNLESDQFIPYYATTFDVSLDLNESVSFYIRNSSGSSVYPLMVEYEYYASGSKQVPALFTPGEAVNFTAEDEEEYTYFKLTGEATRYLFTSDSDCEVYYLGTDKDSYASDKNEGTLLASGEVVDLSGYYKTFYFKALGKDISFKFDYDEGTANNPHTLELDKSASFEVPVLTYYPGYTAWYAFTADADADYVIELNGDASAALYAGSTSGSSVYLNGKTSYSFESGETYYISLTGYNYSDTTIATTTLKIREVAEEDFGLIPSMPVSFNGNTAKTSLIDQNVYLVYTATEDGYVTFSADNDLSTSYFSYYSDADFTAYLSAGGYGDFGVKAGDKIYLRVNTSFVSGETTFTADFTPATATATFTVNVSSNDDSTVNGVEVKISDGENEYTATVVNGVATFENKPVSHYTVSINLDPESDYGVARYTAMPRLSNVNKEGSVTLIKYVDYTFTIAVAEGLTLPDDFVFVVTNGDYGPMGYQGEFTYAELASGNATLKLAFNGYYEIELDEELEDGYELYYHFGEASCTIAIRDIVIDDDDDTPNPWVIGSTEPIQVTANEEYSFTAQANKTYTFTVSAGSFYTYTADGVDYVVKGVLGKDHLSWLDNYTYAEDGESVVSITYTTMGAEWITLAFSADAEVTVTVE